MATNMFNLIIASALFALSNAAAGGYGGRSSGSSALFNGFGSSFGSSSYGGSSSSGSGKSSSGSGSNKGTFSGFDFSGFGGFGGNMISSRTTNANGGQILTGDAAYSGQSINAAVHSSHTVEVMPVSIPQQVIQPQTIEVDAGELPLVIHFKSASSRLQVTQSHQGSGPQEEQYTSSEDEPHRLVHEVSKPIIQEVREVITPYRRVIQEIRPVQEEIQTIVSKGEPRSSGVAYAGGAAAVGTGSATSSSGYSSGSSGYSSGYSSRSGLIASPYSSSLLNSLSSSYTSTSTSKSAANAKVTRAKRIAMYYNW